MHEVEPPVDLVEAEPRGDHRVDLDLAGHVPVDDPRHVGAPARAAEGRAFPDAARDELEGAGFMSSPRWADIGNLPVISNKTVEQAERELIYRALVDLKSNIIEMKELLTGRIISSADGAQEGSHGTTAKRQRCFNDGRNGTANDLWVA